MFCERPFNCSNNATEVKVRTRERLKALFAAPMIDPASDTASSVGQCVTPGNKIVRGADGAFYFLCKFK